MTIEYNKNVVKDSGIIGSGVMITPPIDEDYWFIRVPLSENQAIVAFPKFMTFGIGFQHEEDWNTNLPYSCDADAIYSHISHNKGDDNIPDDSCIEAIKELQAELKRIKCYL